MKTIPIFVPHQGCPLNCLFCNQNLITGQKEKMTPELAESIIKAGLLNKQPGDRFEIGFFGGSFTGIHELEQEKLLAVAQKAMARGQVDGIRLSTRPDYISQKILDRLLSFGVTCVELGAQSMDDDVLRQSARGHNAEQTIMAAEMIRNRGLKLGLQMMLGLPGDTRDKAVFTAQEFIRLGADCVRIYPTLVLKGTGLANLLNQGNYVPLSLEESVSQCAEVFRLFKSAGVQVIRMGLLSVEKDELLAGPWHPAFGELVLSRVFYNKLSEAVSLRTTTELDVCVHPRDLSVALGQNKDNVKRLKERFGIKSVKIIADSNINRGEFIIQD